MRIHSRAADPPELARGRLSTPAITGGRLPPRVFFLLDVETCYIVGADMVDSSDQLELGGATATGRRPSRKRAGNANPTVKDVAARAGVAVSTASAVLREDQTCYASEETRSKVLDAARVLGYRPNRFARALRGNRSFTIGLLFGSLSAPSITLAKLAPLEQLAWKAGYRVVVGNYYNSAQRQREHLQEFLANRVDGLILVTADPANADLVKDMMSQGVPLVTIDSIYEFPTPNVSIDRAQGAYLQVEHVLSKGRKRILFITSLDPTGLAPQKIRGYEAALAAHGSSLAEHLVVSPGGSLAGDQRFTFGARAVEQVLAKGERFDAVIVSADSMAVGVMQALHKAGLRVPEDIAVMGFDDEDFASALPTPLTTVRQPRDVGERAFEMLLAQIEGKAKGGGKQPPQVCLSPTLVIRGSA